jgi:hypothetical protein
MIIKQYFTNNILPKKNLGVNMRNMKKLLRRMKRILLPITVVCLSLAVALAVPIAGLGVVLSATITSTTYKIENLPAKYALVGDSLPSTLPTVTSSGSVQVWHAGRKIDTSSHPSSPVKYTEVGSYEYRFYKDASPSDPNNYFESYTVTVTKEDYTITMPTNSQYIIPTVIPSSAGTLVLPMPKEIRQSGETDNMLEDSAFWTTYSIGVTVSVGGAALTATVDTVNKTVTIANVPTSGKIVVSYLFKKGDTVLAVNTLPDIEIKDTGEVTFANNPTAPSVSGLLYKKAAELTAPTMPTATYKLNGVDTSLTVEGYTKIVAVKYFAGADAPSDWDNVSAVSIAAAVSGDPLLTVDADNVLKIAPQKIGWYKFQFETETRFNMKTTPTDDEDGKYWSDAVNISRDRTAPEIKWVEDYSGEYDSLSTLTEANQSVFDKIGTEKATIRTEDKEDYKKYLPGTTGDSKTKVKNEIYFPALLARDNATEYGQLTYSISVEQVTTANGAASNKSYSVDMSTGGYSPKSKLKIEFTAGSTNATSGNTVTIGYGDGKYRVSFYVYDKNVSGYSDNPVAPGPFYFTVDGGYTVSNPAIDPFYASDVYLWEGNEFEFNVPTVKDDNTDTSGLITDYYVTNSTGFAKLDAPEDGKVTVDISKVTIKTFNNTASTTSLAAGDVKIHAVARNFNALQKILIDKGYGSGYEDGFPTSSAPTDTSSSGTTYKSAEFKIVDNTSAASNNTLSISTDSSPYKQNEAVKLTSVTATWDSSATADSRLSVSVYRIENGKHIYTPLYNDKDEIVTAVLFHGNSYEIKDWSFTPTHSGTYYILASLKENANSTSWTAVAELTVDPQSPWVVEPASVSTMAEETNTTRTALTLGQTGVLPNYRLKQSGATLIAKNRLLYDESTGVLNNDGYYTVTVKGVDDPNCVIGNKFTPHYTGTYRFEYNFYYKVSGNFTLVSTMVHEVSVTASAESTNIKMATDYLNGKDGSNQIGSGTKATVLEEFMLANDGGGTDFTVKTDVLRSGLNETSASSNVYQYPLIAIPMPNVIGETYKTEDVVITVQKSGSSDYLVDTSKTTIRNPAVTDPSADDYYIKSKDGTVEDLFVFRPTGQFSQTTDFMNYIIGSKDDASGVYVVKYTLPNDTVMTFNITVGSVAVGNLKLNEGFLTYKDKDSAVKNIDDTNSTPVIPKGNAVTIHMDKVVYDGENTNMTNFMANFSSTAAPGKTGAGQYMWEEASVTVYRDGTPIVYDYSDGVNAFDKDETKYGERTYSFTPTESGVYKIEIRLWNPYTNSGYATASIEFTYDAEAANGVLDLSTVWGIILIILSVGLLGGVVFYFIKTGKETKFGGAAKKLTKESAKGRGAEVSAAAKQETPEKKKDAE